jgi:DNA-directed RNA polymerase subunit M/transcription elongation factor TFIIS
MGARTVYLIPTDDDLASKAYCQKVTRCVVTMGVIDEEEDEDEGGYLAGPKSLSILSKKADADDAFQSCEIYGSRTARLIPQVPAVSPTCPKCAKKLEDMFYEVVNEVEMNTEDASDYSKVRITCPKCKASHALVELNDPVGIFLASKYICIEDLQGKLSHKWLAEFEKKSGIKHRAYAYWYT